MLAIYHRGVTRGGAGKGNWPGTDKNPYADPDALCVAGSMVPGAAMGEGSVGSA